MFTTEMTAKQAFDQLAIDLGISQSDLASALNISLSTLRTLTLTGAAPTPGTLDRLRTLRSLTNRLQDTIVAEDVPRWLVHKNRYLKGDAPIDALRQGRLDLVEGALEVIDAGIFQ